MDSIKEDIHQELRRLRLDKKHLYSTLLKIIDALPQEAPVPVEVEEKAEAVEVEKVVEEKAEAVEEAPAPVEVEEKAEAVEVEKVVEVKKSGGRKKKTLTVKA